MPLACVQQARVEIALRLLPSHFPVKSSLFHVFFRTFRIFAH
jgi:hypothetical protein